MKVQATAPAPKIQVGVVGVGFGQNVLVPAFRSIGGCEVLGVCASRSRKAAEIAARLGIPKAYSQWEAMLEDSDISAVAIAVPPLQQPEIALAALRKGKAVLCEKPMAAALAPVREMASEAKERAIAGMVDFEFPEIEVWKQARTLLESGRIGALRHIAVTWNVETYVNRENLQSWKADTAQGGDTLNLFASHVFYYLEWFVGRIRRVSIHLLKSPDDPREGHTLVSGCLESESQVPISVVVCSHAFLGGGHRVEFFGNTGTLVLDNSTSDYISGFRLLTGSRGSTTLECIGEDRPSGADGRVEAVARLAGRFVNWIRTGAASTPDWQDGLRVQELLEAARQSHLSGGSLVES